LHTNAIALVTDLEYFPGSRALINSIYAYHPELPIFLFQRGLQKEEFEWLHSHPADIQVCAITHFPYFCPGMWEAKQQAFAECFGRSQVVCLIDADIVLLSRIDDVFQEAAAGKIVAGCDAWRITYEDEFRVYGDELVGKEADGLNSGLLCMDINRHWDVVGLWAFSSNYGRYSPHRGYPLGLPGFGDQGLLNAILVLLRKEPFYHILPHGVWHDFRHASTMRIVEHQEGGRLLVQNSERGERQRINHCVGIKWWQPDAELQHDVGDKLECFRHFEELRFV
jgi:hypothetical protein